MVMGRSRERRDLYASGLLLALALAFGGAGVHFPLLESMLELAGLGLLAHCLASPRGAPLAPQAWFALAILALVLLLPLLQLVPLPPALWTALPGRAFAAEVAALAGQSGLWRPFSLDPEATRRSFLALIPAAAMFIAMLRLSSDSRLRLIGVVIAFALIGVVFGALQLASGYGGFTPYPSSHSGDAVGLFTNRNHQATFLLVAMILAAVPGALPSRPALARGRRRLLSLALIGLLAIGVVVTTSRMGTALVPLALLLSLLILFHDRVGWRLAAAILILLPLAAWLAMQSSVVERTLDRFAQLDDPRFLYWQDSVWAIGQYGWAGSGIGSFIPVYKANETLENVGAALVAEAHNDYLQLALEGGLASGLIFACFLLFLLLAVRRAAFRAPSVRQSLLAFAGAGGIVLVLVHSVVDYPLRMTAIAVLFAMLCGLMVPPPHAHRHDSEADGARARLPRRIGLALAGLVGAGLAWQSLAAGFSAHALLEQRFENAIGWAPWSSQALDRRATELLIARRMQEAAAPARAALARSPIDAPALRTLGFVSEAEGRPAQALAYMSAAGRLGWRDTLTQLWLMQHAFNSGEDDVALQRADALLRQGRFRDQIIDFLQEAAADPKVNAALAVRLAERPDWRPLYFNTARRLPSERFDAQESLLLRLAATPPPPRLDEARPFLQRLAEAGDYGRAQRLWLRLGGDAPLHDGGFEASDQSIAGWAGPFEWRAFQLPDVHLTIDEAPGEAGGKALRIRSGGTAVGTMLSQTVLLAPGTYRLSFRIRAAGPVLSSVDAPGEAGGYAWDLVCLGSRPGPEPDPAAPSWAAASGDAWTETSTYLSVPEGDCPVQQLRLRSTAASGRANSFWLDDVRVGKASDGLAH